MRTQRPLATPARRNVSQKHTKTSTGRRGTGAVGDSETETCGSGRRRRNG